MKNLSKRVVCFLAALCLAVAFVGGSGLSVAAEEDAAAPIRAEAWLRGIVGKGVAPFYATVGETGFEELLARMDCKIEEGTNDRGDLELTATYTDAATSLEFVVTGTLQPKSNAAKVVTSVTNKGTSASPVITDLCGLKTELFFERDRALLLETTNGCLASTVDDDYDYTLIEKTMGVGGSYTFAPNMGRPTDRAWPYFIFTGGLGGAAVCIGWTGQWEATFAMTAKGGLSVEARQQTFRAYLNAGETVRTPSVCVMFFDGDSESGHNAMRRLITNYYTPANIATDGSNYPLPMNCGIGNSAANMTKWLKGHVDNGIDTNTLWIDAAWYGVDADNWSGQVGTWSVNRTLYPKGMKAFADNVHANGYKFLVWFELERARETSTGAQRNRNLYYTAQSGSNLLLRLDSEKGYAWMRDTLVNDIREWGIDVYRQDFNIQPLRFWQSNDGKDRKGITENHYITNLYRLFDELLETFPNLVIDNCSSGGRRLDMKMMSRSVPLWFTDYSCNDTFTIEGAQYQATCLSLWFPYFSAGFRGLVYDEYSYKGAASVSLSFPAGITSADKLKQIVSMYKDLRKFYTGDYYLLFEPAFDTVSWQGREYVLEDKSEAIAIIVVREESAINNRKILFKGLDPDANYDVTEIDGLEIAKGLSGADLMEKGLSINLPSRSAKIFKFTKAA